MTNYSFKWGKQERTDHGTRWEIEFNTGYKLPVELRNFDNSIIMPKDTGLVRLPPPEQLFSGAGPQVSSWREGQAEVAMVTDFLLKKTGYPVFLDAPTGSGKSVIALGIAALSKGARIVTADRSLQDQYAEIPIVESVTGRANWECPEYGGTAADAPCSGPKLHYRECPSYQKGICPYYVQKERAIGSLVLVTNYQYWLRNMHQLILDFPVILDEAHLAELQVREFQKVQGLPINLKYLVSNSSSDYRRWVTERLKADNYIPEEDDFNGWLKYLHEMQDPLMAEITRLSDKIIEASSLPDADTELMRIQREHLNDILLKAMGAIQLLSNQGEPLLELKNDKLTVTPIRGYPHLTRGDVFMSATLVSPEVTMSKRLWYVEMPSTFPVENRPVISHKVANVSRRGGESAVASIAAAIDRLMIQHSHEKGLVHTVSYDLARQIVEASQFQSLMITHSPGDRDRAIEEFRNAPPGRVLLSPSVAAGVDLPYDLCRWQVIAKVPFPNLGDPLSKRRQERWPELSNLDTARQIVQMAGRAVRAADDSAVTYILDTNFRWFYRQHFKLFPAWFREAVRFEN